MSNLDNTESIIERKIQLIKSNLHLKTETELTKASVQLDKQMRVLSTLSLMLLPLTVITGMWGMNWKVPFVIDDVDTVKNLFHLQIKTLILVNDWK